jgi:hypothetical protein
MRLKRAILVSFLFVVTVYVASYLMWSRCFQWQDGRLWSFFPPPAGLMSLDLPGRYRPFGRTPWDGWKRVEGIPGTVFGPCIVVDDYWRERTYLPTYSGPVCFN